MTDELDRLFTKLDIGDCWLWTGYLIKGYGGVKFKGHSRRAHRVIYELLVGPIPDGLTLDHLCRVRRCCNPDHLQPVTVGENVRRGALADVTRARHAQRTHCKRGHEFTPENTFANNNGRGCLACRRLTQHAFYLRSKT